jgi:pyridoxal phosphate enzyme (YggS family)
LRADAERRSETPTDDVAGRYARIRARIEGACSRSGREVGEVTLIGASKIQPVERLRAAWEAGLRIFGENRVQEARDKQAQLPDEAAWHLLGPLQSNKARLAVNLFSVVHSIDRLKIARVLDREALRAGRPLEGFIEVNLGDEPTKHGFATADLFARIAPLAELEHLRIVGLMAIPPISGSEAETRAWFRRLRELRDEMLSRPEWRDVRGDLSMGMSQDFELAIEEGSTHVRIGTDLFGPRNVG